MYRLSMPKLPCVPAAKMNCPVGSGTTSVMLKVVLTGEPEIADKTPVAGFKVNSEIFCEPKFPAYTNPEEPSTATVWGPVPAAKGEPGMGFSAPVFGLMLKTETLFEPLFGTKANRPWESVEIDMGFVPAANGEPDTPARAPVAGFKVYTETSFDPELAA